MARAQHTDHPLGTREVARSWRIAPLSPSARQRLLDALVQAGGEHGGAGLAQHLDVADRQPPPVYSALGADLPRRIGGFVLELGRGDQHHPPRPGVGTVVGPRLARRGDDVALDPLARFGQLAVEAPFGDVERAGAPPRGARRRCARRAPAVAVPARSGPGAGGQGPAGPAPGGTPRGRGPRPRSPVRGRARRAGRAMPPAGPRASARPRAGSGRPRPRRARAASARRPRSARSAEVRGPARRLARLASRPPPSSGRRAPRAPARRLRRRRIGVERRQQRHLLAGRRAAAGPSRRRRWRRCSGRPAGRALRLHGAHLRQVARGHRLDAAVERPPAVEAARLQRVERLLRGMLRASGPKPTMLPSPAATTNSGGRSPPGFSATRLSQRPAGRLLLQQRGERARRRRLEDRRERQPPAGDALELVEQRDGEQRVAAEREEVVLGADRARPPAPLRSSRSPAARSASAAPSSAPAGPGARGRAPAGGRGRPCRWR